MKRFFNRTQVVFVACVILALVSGCSSAKDQPSPDMSAGPTGGAPPPVGTEGPGGNPSAIYGGLISQADLPAALVDDPNLLAPVPRNDETPTPMQLQVITSPWPAKSPSEILALLHLEAQADAQLTQGQRDALAQLGLATAPSNP